MAHRDAGQPQRDPRLARSRPHRGRSNTVLGEGSRGDKCLVRHRARVVTGCTSQRSALATTPPGLVRTGGVAAGTAPTGYAGLGHRGSDRNERPRRWQGSSDATTPPARVFEGCRLRAAHGHVGLGRAERDDRTRVVLGRNKPRARQRPQGQWGAVARHARAALRRDCGALKAAGCGRADVTTFPFSS